jgi:hypothetical protein
MIKPMKAKYAMMLTLALMIGASELHGEDSKVHPDLLNALSRVDSDGSYLELNSVSEDMEVLTKYSWIRPFRKWTCGDSWMHSEFWI